MKLVIKLGGYAAEDAKNRNALAREITALHRAGHAVVVVHGGGKVLTRTLERLGLESKFYRGLRVTDAATRDAALMVLAGLVNKQWVAEFERAGQPALGLTGGDGGLVRARKLVLGANGQRKDLGYVGRPVKVNPGVLELAFAFGLVPVVASLGMNARGEFLNINADDLAAALAAALSADRLLYLTESGGVWDSEKRLLAEVKTGEIRRLIRQGVVRDGMIPKLLSCRRTLQRNVGEVDILSPYRGALWKAVAQGKVIGTRIVR